MAKRGQSGAGHWDGLSERDRAYLKLLDAFKQEGCAVCRLSSEAVEIYLSMLLREGVIDVDVRQALRDARGLCNAHAWDLMDRQDELGTAIIYQDMVNSVLRILKAGLDGQERSGPARRLGALVGAGRASGATLAARLRERATCPACRIRAEAETRWTELVLEFFPQEQFSTGYLDSDGLCVDHLAGALDRSNTQVARRLVDHQIARFETNHAHLTEVIRKHDYRFRDEPKGDEAGSGERAIRYLARLRGAR